MYEQESMDQQLLKRLNQAIEDNLQNEHFGVTELADAAGLSKSQLNRKLQSLTCQSASQFIREYRLKTAMELLHSKSATASEVSFLVGFGSPSYFSTCFKEYYGYSPHEVKYQVRNESSSLASKLKKPSILYLGLIIIVVVVYLTSSRLLLKNRTKEPEKNKISIAILPVKDYSNDSSNNNLPLMFAEDITNKLSKINEFSIIESSFTQDIAVQEIGSALDADLLLGVGFALTDKDFELVAKITDANSGTVILSEYYNQLVGDLQDVQNEVVFSIARKLGVTITSTEEKQITQKITKSNKAYNYYLVGSEFLSRLESEENMRMASDLFEKAIALDSGFANAWIGLYSANKVIYARHYDRTDVQYQKVEKLFEKAKSLDPELLQIKIVMSEDLNKTEQLLFLKNLLHKYPENDPIYKKIGGIHRSLRQNDSALYYIEKAIELNPTEFHHRIIAGVLHWNSRRYSKALKCYFEALELKPTLKIPHPAYLYVEMGELAKAREYLTKLVQDDSKFNKGLSHIEYLQRNFPEAISYMEKADSLTDNFHSQFRTKLLELGLIYYIMGDRESARTHFEYAKIQMNKKLEEIPEDPRALSSLAIAYAGIGMKNEAIETVKKALSIVQMLGPFHQLGYRELDVALVYIMVGEYDQAMKQLEYLMEIGKVGVWELKLDPIWDPLREMPQYQVLTNNPDYQPIL